MSTAVILLFMHSALCEVESTSHTVRPEIVR